jgi:tetratricopeptide (TPR) repeat protein
MAPSLLILVMLSASMARAQPAPAPVAAVPAADAPAPELVSLDASLKKTQDAKATGTIDEKAYREFVTRFRAQLDAAMAAVAPTPANTALQARILSRLGDPAQAEAALGTALKRAPDDPVLRVALSQVRYDKKDYAGALAEADAVLARDPSNKAALALKHFSEGRVEAGASSAASSLPTTGTPGSVVSPGLQALIGAGANAHETGDHATELRLALEAMRLEPTSPAAQEFYRAAAMESPRPRGANDSLLRGLAAAEVSVPPSGPSPVPFAPLAAAGAVCGLGAWALFCRKSDDPRLRGPLTAMLMTGLGATGVAFAGGAYHMLRAPVATDVGMFNTGQAPLLQHGPRAESSPGQPNDCTDQLKKLYPLQQDAQHKRQVALAALQPILDKYGLSFEMFQSVFGKLNQSFVASCDADADACQLLANKDDWTVAQATYGQIQILDQKLQVLSGSLAKLMDKCRISGETQPKENKREGAKDREENVPVSGPGAGGTEAAIAEQISSGHAFDKHVVEKGEFKDLGIDSRKSFARFIADIIRAAKGDNVRELSNSRTAYWDSATSTVVIHDPSSPDGGTVFRPKLGRKYFEEVLK